jgi:hypothetical protein
VSGNVGIGTTTPSLNAPGIIFDVSGDTRFSGNINVSRFSTFKNIKEQVTTLPTSSSYICDYSSGAVFYLNSPTSNNFSITITNIPNTSDLSYCYIITLVYTVPSGASSCYCNSVTIGATAYSTANGNMIFNGGSTNIFTSQGNYVFQQITYSYLGSTSKVLSSVNVYS